MADVIRKTLDKDLLKQELMSALVGTLAAKSDVRAKFIKNPSEFLKNNGINPNSVNIEALCKAVYDLDKKLSKAMIDKIGKAFPKFPAAFIMTKPIVPKPIVPKPIVPKPIVPQIKPYMPCLDVKIDIDRIKVLEDLKPLITKEVLNRIVNIKK